MRIHCLMYWKSTIIGLMAFILLTVSGISWSRDLNMTNFGSETPTPAQIKEALKPNRSWRGIKKVKKAVSMELKFDFDSYRLSAEAEKIVNILGIAMQDQEFSQYSFLIEGHTHATGSQDYNKILSEKRAENVKQYLVNRFGIDPIRVRTVGRGELDLLDKSNPESSINRRVQVVNLQ